MKPFLNTVVHKILALAGLTAVRSHQTYEADRMATMRRRGVDLIVDVGANVGQYARALRQRGYSGAIVSLEPLPDAYASLATLMRTDHRWHGINAAAGAQEMRAKFNISADSVCSSLLEPSPTLLHAIPTARVVRTVEVDMVRLADISLPSHGTMMLKLDVQGFEKEALTGAGDLIGHIDVLELELSLKPSYETGYTLGSALPELTALGFTLVSIGRGVSDPATGGLIDIDVLLERSS